MAMSDDTMRLVYEVVAKSDSLKDLMKALKQTADTAKAVHGSGAAQAREHAKAYRELHEQIRKIKDTAIDVVQPGMAALGVTAFSVAGAIAAVASAVKGFGDAGQALTFISRQSGITIAMIRGLADAGQAYGVTQEQTNAGLAKFGAFMDQNARRAPDALNAWNQMPGAWQRIGRSLVGLNRDAQVNKVLDFIPSVKYMDQRRKLLQIMGLPEDWANLTREEIAKMRAASEEVNRLHPFALENAVKAKAAWEAMASSLRGIRDDMGAAFGPNVVRGVEAVQSFLDDKDHVDEMRQAFATMGDTIGKVVTTLAQDLKDIESAYAWFKTPGGPALPQGFVDSLTGKSKSPNLRPHSDSTPFGPVAPSDIEKNVRKPITEGVIEGLKQFFDSKNVNPKMGYKPISFDPDWGGGLGGGSRGGYFGSRDYPALDPNTGQKAGGGGKFGPETSGDAGGSIGSTFDRSRFAKELADKPWLKEKIFQLSAGEDRPSSGSSALANQAVMESMMNRAVVRGTSLEQQARWYGREKGGYYAGHPSHLSAHEREVSEENMRKVLSGSNITDYATDNSSGGLAAREKASGKFKFHKDFHGESFFSPGWAEPGFAKRWSSLMQSTHGANLRDHIRGGRSPQTDGELLKRGMKAVDSGVGTNHSLSIDLNGFPRGTKTAFKEGGLFKEVALNRGRPMAPASETS
jgi:hypothetical protein